MPAEPFSALHYIFTPREPAPTRPRPQTQNPAAHLRWGPAQYDNVSLCKRELCFSLVEILVLDGTAGTGGTPPPSSTRISVLLG